MGAGGVVVGRLSEEHLDVLFAGDDEDLAEVYRMKLELDGYVVRIVERDEDWPSPPWRPDIAYLDVPEAGSLGARAHARLRSDPLTSGTPAIILSSLRSSELARAGVTLGQLDYLVAVIPSVRRGSPGERRRAAAAAILTPAD